MMCRVFGQTPGLHPHAPALCKALTGLAILFEQENNGKASYLYYMR